MVQGSDRKSLDHLLAIRFGAYTRTLGSDTSSLRVGAFCTHPCRSRLSFPSGVSRAYRLSSTSCLQWRRRLVISQVWVAWSSLNVYCIEYHIESMITSQLSESEPTQGPWGLTPHLSESEPPAPIPAGPVCLSPLASLARIACPRHLACSGGGGLSSLRFGLRGAL